MAVMYGALFMIDFHTNHVSNNPSLVAMLCHLWGIITGTHDMEINHTLSAMHESVIDQTIKDARVDQII